MNFQDVTASVPTDTTEAPKKSEKAKAAKKKPKKKKLTPRQRSRVNSKNASMSTGPRTPAGLAAAAKNSLDHGLCADPDKTPLTGDDLARYFEIRKKWCDDYNPQTVGELTLIHEIAYALTMRERAARYVNALTARKIRHARDDWDKQQSQRLNDACAILKTDPARAVLELWHFGLGCRYMIARWERLDAIVADPTEPLRMGDLDEIVLLLGVPAEDTRALREHEHAEEAVRHADRLLITVPAEIAGDGEEAEDLRRARSYRDGVARRFEPKRKEAVPFDAPGRQRSEAWLRSLIATKLAGLRERERYVREELDAPDREEAPLRAGLLEGSEGANFLRYERQYALAQQRAYATFVKGRKDAEKSGTLPGMLGGSEGASEGGPEGSNSGANNGGVPNEPNCASREGSRAGTAGTFVKPPERKKGPETGAKTSPEGGAGAAEVSPRATMAGAMPVVEAEKAERAYGKRSEPYTSVSMAGDPAVTVVGGGVPPGRPSRDS